MRASTILCHLSLSKAHPACFNGSHKGPGLLFKCWKELLSIFTNKGPDKPQSTFTVPDTSFEAEGKVDECLGDG